MAEDLRSRELEPVRHATTRGTPVSGSARLAGLMARSNGTSDVVAFLDASSHARIGEVRLVRDLILAAEPTLTERIKWNAPSFAIDDDDRITFRLQPGDRVDLVFHRGTGARDDLDTFRFADPSGLLRSVTADRGTVAFANREDIEAKRERLSALVVAWLAATRT